VLEFPLPSSCIFFLHWIPLCNIFVLLWLFFAIGSIHQEAQTVKFNCSCTSGLLRLQLSYTNYKFQLLAILQDISGFNCLLRFFLYFKFNGVFFGFFYLIINIYFLSLSNSLSIRNLAKFLILKIAILSSKSSKLIAASTFNKLPSLITNFKDNFQI
jgi:hypothetical protein